MKNATGSLFDFLSSNLNLLLACAIPLYITGTYFRDVYRFRSANRKHENGSTTIPPTAPYIIPYVGHAIAFLRDPTEFVKQNMYAHSVPNTSLHVQIITRKIATSQQKTHRDPSASN
jgi:hypothetical protein